MARLCRRAAALATSYLDFAFAVVVFAPFLAVVALLSLALVLLLLVDLFALDCLAGVLLLAALLDLLSACFDFEALSFLVLPCLLAPSLALACLLFDDLPLADLLDAVLLLPDLALLLVSPDLDFCCDACLLELFPVDLLSSFAAVLLLPCLLDPLPVGLTSSLAAVFCLLVVLPLACFGVDFSAGLAAGLLAALTGAVAPSGDTITPGSLRHAKPSPPPPRNSDSHAFASFSVSNGPTSKRLLFALHGDVQPCFALKTSGCLLDSRRNSLFKTDSLPVAICTQ